MRTLTDHIVSGDQAVQLTIEVLDEPGQGGANHMYRITGMDVGRNASYEPCAGDKPGNYDGPEDSQWIMFQNGPIKLSPVTGGSAENKKFFRWTPFGKIELGTLNPEAWKQFPLGAEIYVDFSPVEASNVTTG